MGAVVATFTGTPWTPALDLGDVRQQVESISDECAVEMPAGVEEPLSLKEARAAMTVVVEDPGAQSWPEVAGVSTEMLDRIASGPAEAPGPVLTCEVNQASGLEQQDLTETGLTPRAQAVLDGVNESFGEQSIGGFAPGGISSGHGAESTHYEGRAVDIFFRPITDENQREGWLMAQWLVAHADLLDLQYVIYDDRYWGVRGSRRGWRDYDAPAPANDVLRHLDHIHVDVPRGTEDA